MEPDESDLESIKEQLVLARQKAAEMKKQRSAPKKELKKLEDERKERLYQDDLRKVQHLKSLNSHSKVSNSKDESEPQSPTEDEFEDPHHGIPTHLRDLINVLYA